MRLHFMKLCPVHLQPLIKGKKLLPLERNIFVELNYSDVEVVDDICKGFPLGWTKKTDIFEPCVRRLSIALNGFFFV